MKIEVEIPDKATMGDLRTVQGALTNAATEWIDFEDLHEQKPDAIGAPGAILLDIANQIGTNL